MKPAPPVIPGNFYAAGLNFRAHTEWANSRGGKYKVPEQADIGYRSSAKWRCRRQPANAR